VTVNDYFILGNKDVSPTILITEHNYCDLLLLFFSNRMKRHCVK